MPRLRRPLRPTVARIAMAAAAALATGAQAASFEVVALGGSTPLPFSSGTSTSYGFNLRQPTLADDGWVGFAPAQAGPVPTSYMLGRPGEVLHVVSAGDSVSGTLVTTLRDLRVDSGRRVSFTASPAGSITLHYASEDLATALPARLAAGDVVYNRTTPSGPITFELLPGGQQLVSATQPSGSNPSFETGRLSEAGGYAALVRSNLSTSRALPTVGAPGVGIPAAGRTWASAQAVGGDSAGRTFLYGLQSGTGIRIDGADVRGNLVEVRPDGTRLSIAHPGSTVPGVALPSQGIHPNLAQFASGGGSTLAFRNDFGRNTTSDRKLTGAILRYDAAASVDDSRLGVVALPGANVPGLVSSNGGSVSFGHKVGVDSGGALAPLSMLPDNLVPDSARGLAVNAAGTVAFVSAVTAAPAAAGYGVFLARADGSFATLASSGTVTAGSAPGTDGTFAKFHDVALNDAGLVVFSATLTGAEGRQGYWFGHDAADLQLLVMEGQQIEVQPGVFKTVGNLDTGLHDLADIRVLPLDDGLNNAGLFAFSVIFDDGTQAVLRTPLVSSVPEPASAVLWLAGLALLGGLARRRR